MLSTMLWLFLILAVDVHHALGYIFQTNACEDHRTPFRVELQTNYYADRTNWKVIDIVTRNEVLSSSPYSDKYYLHEEDHCLDPDKCYQFIIEHLNSLVADPYYGREDGFYRIVYDGILIGEGSKFENDKDEESIYFGDSCPCEEHETPFRVELQTNYHADRTNWKVIDTVTRNEVLSSSPYSDKNYLHEEDYCLDSDKCYQFIIEHLNSLVADPDHYGEDGFYRIMYDGILIGEGSKFENDEDEESIYFGDNCDSTPPSYVPSYPPSTSITPTESSVPTASQMPSNAPLSDIPSMIPSYFPSVSTKPSQNPSKSLQPSIAPTVTPNPTAVASQTVVQTFEQTYKQRIRYPSRRNHTEVGSFSLQKLPNCVDEPGRVGCVTLPSALPILKRDWAGKNHFSPPKCVLNAYGRHRKCKMGLPMSIDILQHNITASIFPGFEEQQLFGQNIIDDAVTVVSGDLNADGYLDVVVGFEYQKNKIFMNNGNGTFHESELDGGNRRTRSIAFGDLNGDQVLDIVIGNYLGDSNQALLSNDGNSYDVIDLPGDPQASTASIAIADMDEDGKLDVIVGNLQSRDKSFILLNSGDGKFYHTVDLVAEAISTIAVGDLDNNGKNDIILGVKQGPIKLLMNNGNMDFTDVTLGDGDTPSTVGLADMDGNGLLDILVGNRGNKVNLLYKNNGDLTFKKIILPGGDANTQDISLGDFDGDGLVDIAVLNYGTQNKKSDNQILLNNGNDAYRLIYLDERNDKSMAVSLGDFNNDGLMDMIVVTGKGGSNDLYWNIVDDNYQIKELPGDSNFEGKAVALEDLNGDNILDIIVGNGNEPNQIFSSNKSGNYDPFTLPGGAVLTDAIAVADLDGNGLLDVVVGNRGSPNQILLQMGDFNYTVQYLPNSYFTSSIAVADIDDDGFLDIVVGNVDHANEVLYGDRYGNFTAIELPGGVTEAIAVGDLDGNDKLDIVVGDVVLFNDGNRTFHSINLTDPEDSSSIRCIALGDLNNDTQLDIVLGNEFATNKLLINDGNDAFLPLVLPGGKQETSSVALGDINGDGMVDIVFGNADDSNLLLLNSHNASFVVAALPGERVQTQAIAISDLDDDGVLEVVTVNRYDAAQVIFYSSCPNGGAKLHTGSWCFKCPRYMGRPVFFNHEQSSCLECMPDYMQQSGAGEQCSQEPCPLSERELGSPDCARCEAGTYYDNTIVRREYDMTSWNPQRCVPCRKGHYSDGNSTAINTCFECPSGRFQPDEGKSSCKPCNLGSFQPNRGQSTCNKCPAGGYCDKFDVCGGGFKACDPGTYNDKQGESNKTACIECGIGTYSAITGANNSLDCQQCPSGSFGNVTGQKNCHQCPIGTYQPYSGESGCLECPQGNYSNTPGRVECTPCPYRLSSFSGSTTCSFCAETFYLNDTKANTSHLFKQPDRYCIGCPRNGVCKPNTTLQTIMVPSNYWRDSLNTSTLYECVKGVCQSSDEIKNRRLSSTSTSHLYCKVGYEGPRCQVCSDDKKYFSISDGNGQCIECPSLLRLFMPIGIIAAILVIIVILRTTASRYTSFGDFAVQVSLLWHSIGPQAKFKILISFYQVVTTLDPVYGVRFDPKLQEWFEFLEKFNFTYQILFLPEKCFGTMTSRLVIGAIWPFFVIFIGFCGISVYTILKHEPSDNKYRTNMMSIIGQRTLKFAIVFMYIVLPGVSRAIFSARKCERFETNDELGTGRSYLFSDLSMRCGGKKHADVLRLFWGLFVLWPLMIPLLMLGLLWKVRHFVRNKRTTSLVEACSFLWRDYNEGMMYWEVIDLYRKLILTGFILFIDLEDGNARILRLLMANAISFIYFGVLLRARPYKRSNDLDLAFISNILLLGCFTLGIILHFCQDGQDVPCKNYIGLNMGSYGATLLTIGLTALMLVITAIFLLIISLNAITTPSIRLVNTGSKPNLEVPGDCKFHAFFSHIWSTGKDKTHTAVRKVQLLMPGVRIWLDADELTHVDKLEESVAECVIVLIFYTKGYFKSTNCQREVLAAVSLKKPIYVLYDSETSDIGEMKAECIDFCKDGSIIVGDLCANEPIPWLGSSGTHFAIESVKLVSLTILRHLPHYKRIPSQLTQGVKVVGEMSQVKFQSPVDILVCQENVGARRTAEEAKTFLMQSNDYINIFDAKLVFDEISKDRSVLYDNTKILLLYLNEDVFLDEDGQVSEMVRMALEFNIKVLNVHELDYEMGACSFDTFFTTNTPKDLIAKGLFKEIAVPLYPLAEYRRVSYMTLLKKMGATETKKSSSNQGFVASASYLIRTSIHRVTESSLNLTSVSRNSIVPQRSRNFAKSTLISNS